jgi:hypothetical protein
MEPEEQRGSMDADQILSLTDHGYTVTFEASGLGDYFCLLRRIQTQELVNCVIGDSLSEALAAAFVWDASERPGNGTARRPTVEEIATDLDGVRLHGQDTRRELLAIIGDLRQQLAGHTDRLGVVEDAVGIRRPSFMPAPMSHSYPANPSGIRPGGQ